MANFVSVRALKTQNSDTQVMAVDINQDADCRRGFPRR
ncbi:hypothetical protein SAMN05216308_101286 [Nitrosospira sp. Nsp13]|nr:hypothetical protein SAMN05216308_101286 [Nitrosospira sp. Nsp13]